MKRKPNYLKHLLQWGVLAAIVGTVLWAKFSDKPVDVEAYCPFGGLQAFGTYLVNNSLACSMSMLQIMMGLVLAVGVILFSKLFCGYLCPLGTVGEWMGRAGKKLHLQVDVPRKWHRWQPIPCNHRLAFLASHLRQSYCEWFGA